MPTNWTVIRSAGAVGGAGGGGGNTPPSNVSALSVDYAFVNPTSRMCTVAVSFTAPSGGTYTGVHLWVEIPDQSSGSTTSMVVGSTPIGNGTVAGPWAPIDLGIQNSTQQPLVLNFAFPAGPGLNPNQNTPCRLYVASISPAIDNTLVRNGQPNATPNVAFTLVSLSSGTSSAGTNVTENCGTIICDVLANQNASGKLVTPVLAIVGSVPSNPPSGWGYRLYISYGNADPTDPANLTPVTEVETVAGIVPAPTKSDGISVQHSFAISTPSATTQATIWAVAGLTVNGAFTPNNVVPGITNSCPITFGSNSGTIDASQVIQSSIETQFQVALGKLGLTPASINASTYLVAGTIVGNLLAASNIITLSAQIGTAVVADANIATCNVSKLQAGTATFTSTAVFQSGSGGPSVAIASTGISLTGGSYSISVGSSSGISIVGTSGSVSLAGSGITLSNGSYQAVVTASNIQLSNSSSTLALNSSGLSLSDGSQSLTVSSSSVSLQAGSNSLLVTASTITLTNSTNELQLTSSSITLSTSGSVAVSISSSGAATFTSGGSNTVITGNLVACNQVSMPFVTIGPSTLAWGIGAPTASSATAGSATLPSNPALFMEVTISGTTYKFPLYNN